MTWPTSCSESGKEGRVCQEVSSQDRSVIPYRKTSNLSAIRPLWQVGPGRRPLTKEMRSSLESWLRSSFNSREQASGRTPKRSRKPGLQWIGRRKIDALDGKFAPGTGGGERKDVPVSPHKVRRISPDSSNCQPHKSIEFRSGTCVQSRAACGTACVNMPARVVRKLMMGRELAVATSDRD
ncbi:hypothetical protein ANO11243_067560 [Dothideomycetidae sp. 11243]|nr:hypothetical protein ANO11243_067560 [fungal sp. No.11243]